MNTVFIGGSRHISRLSNHVKERLNSVIQSEYKIILGDANGADKSVQKHLLDSGYRNVTVFCSGDHYRNNLGQWPTHKVIPPGDVKGFQFYAAKDREMANEADFGIMIWDGKSPGTILNVLRLVKANKKSVIFHEHEKRTSLIKSSSQWEEFLTQCSSELISDLRERATPDEWTPNVFPDQTSFFESEENATNELPAAPFVTKTENELAIDINSALESGNAVVLIDAISDLARKRGLARVERDAFSVRESLIRSQSNSGSSEFAALLRIIAEVGFRLPAKKTRVASTTKRKVKKVQEVDRVARASGPHPN